MNPSFDSRCDPMTPRAEFSGNPKVFHIRLSDLIAKVIASSNESGTGGKEGRTASAATFVGYVLSRTTGLPAATADIGNWTEPLGLASLFVEGSVVAMGAYALSGLRRR